MASPSRSPARRPPPCPPTGRRGRWAGRRRATRHAGAARGCPPHVEARSYCSPAGNKYCGAPVVRGPAHREVGGWMLSDTAEYALRATLYIAQHANDTRLVRTDETAQALGVPRNYLSKILHVLARHGVLSSTRGPLGGFRL